VQAQTYHRVGDSPEAIQQIQQTGTLLGNPGRLSNIPQVRAFPGPLPEGSQGFEFTTTAQPTGPAGTFTGSQFHEGNPGVTLTPDSQASINVTVTKVQPPPNAPPAKTTNTDTSQAH
jgi:hypothetical protein